MTKQTFPHCFLNKECWLHGGVGVRLLIYRLGYLNSTNARLCPELDTPSNYCTGHYPDMTEESVDVDIKPQAKQIFF